MGPCVEVGAFGLPCRGGGEGSIVSRIMKGILWAKEVLATFACVLRIIEFDCLDDVKIWDGGGAPQGVGEVVVK
jgi:hypothetical protein